MINYNLNITNIKTNLIDGKDNVVTWVGWELVANNDSKTISFSGQSIWDAPEEQFTPFEQLTEEQVKSWIEAVEPLDSHKKSLEQQFNWFEQTEQNQPLPWTQK